MKKITGIICPRDVLHFLGGENTKHLSLKEELEATREKLEQLKIKLDDTKNILKHYQDLYNDAPTMMHSVDAQGKIVMANKEIHNKLGYEPGELLGKSIFDLYSKSSHQEATFGLKKIMDQGFHHNTYTTMITKDGRKLRVDVVSSALRGDHNEFIGTISASRLIDSDALLRALHGAFNDEPDKIDEIESLITKNKDKGSSNK